MSDIVQNSVYKNFRMIQIWASKRRHDSGTKMRKFQNSENTSSWCRRTSAIRKEEAANEHHSAVVSNASNSYRFKPTVR